MLSFSWVPLLLVKKSETKPCGLFLAVADRVAGQGYYRVCSRRRVGGGRCRIFCAATELSPAVQPMNRNVCRRSPLFIRSASRSKTWSGTVFVRLSWVPQKNAPPGSASTPPRHALPPSQFVLFNHSDPESKFGSMPTSLPKVQCRRIFCVSGGVCHRGRRRYAHPGVVTGGLAPLTISSSHPFGPRVQVWL